MEVERKLNAVYLEAPGYINDLVFMFVMYFNKDHILNSFVNYDKAKEDIAFYNGIFHKVSPVAEKLSLFFNLKDGQGSLISKYYTSKHADLFLQEEPFTAKRFTDLFRDVHRMTEAVSKHYFPQQEPEEIEQMSIEQIASLLEKTQYSNELKYLILNYYMQPEEYIDLLINTMLEKEAVLQEYREKYKETVDQAVNNFDVYETVRNLKRMPGKEFSIEMFEPIYYSFSILNKIIINFLELKTDCITVLGIEYSEFIEFLLRQKDGFDVVQFGKIMSVDKRITILNTLLKKEELTKHDVVKALKLSMTATHYHMDMMVQARMLTVRNEGRTMYHKLNRSYFGEVIEEMTKYYDENKDKNKPDIVKMSKR